MRKVYVWRMVAVLVMLMAAGVGFAQEAKVRTSLEAPEKVWVGQRVTLVVELLSPTFFSGSPVFDLPKQAGVVILPPMDHPVQGTVQVDGASYTSQRYELWVFAQRSGKVEIPAFGVRFDTSGVGAAKPTEQAMSTQPVSFQAELPAGAKGLSSLISTTDLTVSDEWTPQEAGMAKVGDAFTHKITFEASDVPGMAFPELPMPSVTGMAVYTKPAQVNDEVNRGDLKGKRVETMTYVCQTAGTLVIPDYTLTWWDLDDEKLKTVRIAGRTVEVAPAPVVAKPETGAVKEVEKSFWSTELERWGVVIVAMVLGVVFGRWVYPRMAREGARRRAIYAASEVGLFAALKASCARGEPEDVYGHLLRWWERTPAGLESVAGFARKVGEGEMAGVLEAFEGALFGAKADKGEAGRLAVRMERGLAGLRKKAIEVGRDGVTYGGLVGLNPSRGEWK